MPAAAAVALAPAAPKMAAKQDGQEKTAQAIPLQATSSKPDQMNVWEATQRARATSPTVWEKHECDPTSFDENMVTFQDVRAMCQKQGELHRQNCLLWLEKTKWS